MTTIDLSRSATDFRKHFTSVRAQMGRVFTDDDHNDNERLHAEDERRSLIDIIGPDGSPDGGFLIKNPTITGGKINFDISPGSFYLGGNRLDLEQVEQFQVQSDWLNMTAADMPAVPAGHRFDLVFLECWHQPVSAVEDSELFEKGLGGPDTSVRMRLMRRVHVAAGTATGDCRMDWATLTATWAATGLGTLNAQDELAVNTKLTVGFEAGTDPADLCTPPVAGGYLGAENQAIRVQLVTTSHFTWGYDNAAPLYRVNVGPNGLGQLRKITMITEPKDEAHWPVAGKIVEILPWSAVLTNKEKASEVSGFLARVDTSYDPDTQELFLATDVPVGFGEDWLVRPDAAALKPEFFYMRVWDRGTDTASPPTIPFVIGTQVKLGNTGLNITFTGTDHHPADFWIIAARPGAPNHVVPWLLESGRGPHGIHHYYAVLGLIEWTAGGGGKVIHDCREKFPPLTRFRSCCTCTVGDGTNTFGAHTSIQAAIDALTEGGEICVLPGVYTENFHVTNRQHIVIHGCGHQTVLKPKVATDPVATIVDSQYITVKDLTIVTDTSIAILIASTVTKFLRGGVADRIVIRSVHFEVRDSAAIGCFYATNLVISENDIHVNQLSTVLTNTGLAGMSPAIFLMGDDVEIARNRIVADSSQRLVSALGGIKLFGLCQRIRIEHNHIEGGNGNGITLGAVFWIDSSADSSTALGNGRGISISVGIWIDAGGCVHVGGGGTPPMGGDGNPQVPVAWGLFFDIRILDNDILNMGASGIGSPDLPPNTQGVPIVEVIEIAHNRIYQCAQLDRTEAATASTAPLPGRGGVALDIAGYVIVRDNWIARNGTSFVPSICGIWIGLGDGVVVERNNILDNGPRIVTQQAFEAGPRAGIRVEFAGPPVSLNLANNVGVVETEFPALRVHDNVVVAPSGPALAAVALGTVSVANNELTAGALDAISAASPWVTDQIRAVLGGAAVFIFDIGALSELTSANIDFSNAALHQAGLAGNPAASTGVAEFVSGDILFNDNRVLLEISDPGQTVVISSVTLFGFADVSSESNQLIGRTGAHLLLTNAFVAGASLRFVANRCQDRFDNGFSGVTIGLMNATANNQGTRCFYATGLPALLVRSGNTSWIDLISKSLCARLGGSLDRTYVSAGFAPFQ